MNGAKLKKVYLLIPLVYLLLSFTFLVFHLSGQKPSGEKHTVFSLSAETFKKLDGKSASLSSVTLKGRGFSIDFSGKTPLLLSTADGKERSLFLKKYQASEGALGLVFDNNFIVRIKPAPENPDSFVISCENPSGLTPGKILFPVKAGKNEIKSKPVIPAVYTGSPQSGTGVLYLGKDSSFDAEKSVLVLSDENPVFTFTSYNKEIDPVLYWFTGDGTYTDEDEYSSAVNTFLDKCYDGLKTGRYSESGSDWRLDKFEEASLVAFAAESIRRGEYEDNLEMLEEIADKHSRSLGIASAFYFGDIMESYHEFSRLRRRRIKSWSRRLDDGDFAVFAENEFPDIIKDPDSAEFAEEVSSFLNAESDSYTPDLASFAGLLDLFVSAEEINGISSADLKPYLGLIDSFLLPLISRHGQYLKADSDTTGLLSVRLGSALIKIARTTGNKLYASIGRDLVISVISQADDFGIMPAVSADNPSGRELPEHLYGFLADSFLPRHIIADEYPIYTAAGEVTAEKSDDELVFRIYFKENCTESIIIRNVPAFSKLSLYGKEWRASTRFYRYDVGGYHYDEEDEILYIKIRHHKDREKVELELEPVSEPESESEPEDQD